MHPKKALVKEILQKSAILKKIADFPAIFLGLKPDARTSISRQYAIGPKSQVHEIPIDSVTKKPYSEGLVVYTTSVLSEAEQRKARDEIEQEMRKFKEDPKFVELHGSIAGNKMWEEKKSEVEAAVNQKYSPKERPVAWGVGTYFNTNSDLFSYHYYGRGHRGYNDAPSNRKALIGYIKTYGGKAYYITKDSDVVQLRTERGQRGLSRPEDEAKQVIRERGKAYGQAKFRELNPLINRAIIEQKQIINRNIEGLVDKIINGKMAYEDPIKHMFAGTNMDVLKQLGYLYWRLSGTYSVDSKEDLLKLMKDTNALIAKLKNKPAPEEVATAA